MPVNSAHSPCDYHACFLLKKHKTIFQLMNVNCVIEGVKKCTELLTRGREPIDLCRLNGAVSHCVQSHTYFLYHLLSQLRPFPNWVCLRVSFHLRSSHLLNVMETDKLVNASFASFHCEKCLTRFSHFTRMIKFNTELDNEFITDQTTYGCSTRRGNVFTRVCDSVQGEGGGCRGGYILSMSCPGFCLGNTGSGGRVGYILSRSCVGRRRGVEEKGWYPSQVTVP